VALPEKNIYGLTETVVRLAATETDCPAPRFRVTHAKQITARQAGSRVSTKAAPAGGHHAHTSIALLYAKNRLAVS